VFELKTGTRDLLSPGEGKRAPRRAPVEVVCRKGGGRPIGEIRGRSRIHRKEAVGAVGEQGSSLAPGKIMERREM